ncbi:MAG: hypothetical protein HY064_10645 [Bacteroidetes bacterium]|nr:hypothetical protein [Bacteroidota bacterium]
MKKLFFTLPALLILLMTSCGPKMHNPLIGKWKFENMAAAKINVTSNGDSSAMGQAGDSLAKGMTTMANALTGVGTAFATGFMKGSIYEFKDNGIVSVSILFGTDDSKYILTPDNKTLTMTKDGKDEVYTVTKVDDKQLVLTTSDGMEETFSRQN